MPSDVYHQAGIRSILTTNPTDFATFGLFNCMTPGASDLRPLRGVSRDAMRHVNATGGCCATGQRLIGKAGHDLFGFMFKGCQITWIEF